MPVPASGWNKRSDLQPEYPDQGHQSQNPQRQISGGVYSVQREDAEEVVNSTQSKQQLTAPCPPSKQHPTPDKYPQGTAQQYSTTSPLKESPNYPPDGQSSGNSQPPRYPSELPPLPTLQQKPKQSNPSTPRNNHVRTQDSQSINFTFLVYPPPQNTEKPPPSDPIQPVALPTYKKPLDEDIAHKQPQTTPNKPGEAPRYQIPTYNKHLDEGTAYEQPTLKPGQAPSPLPGYPHPRNQIPPQKKHPNEETAHEQPTPLKPGQAPVPSPGYPPPKNQTPTYEHQDEDTAPEQPTQEEPKQPPSPPDRKNIPPRNKSLLYSQSLYKDIANVQQALNKPEQTPSESCCCTIV